MVLYGMVPPNMWQSLVQSAQLPPKLGGENKYEMLTSTKTIAARRPNKSRQHHQQRRKRRKKSKQRQRKH